MSEPETHQLPDDVREWMQARIQLIEATKQQLNGALGLYADTHGMKDESWTLSEDGASLTKQEPTP